MGPMRIIFQSLVQKVQDMEKDLNSEKLAIVVAENYFKLLAYKDEYEVARLYSSEAFQTSLKKQFEGNYKLEYHLAPPLLAPIDKHTGLPRKIKFGSWMQYAFKLLAGFKFLRGTSFDPFGYTEDRRLERRLISEYETLTTKLIASLTTDNIELISSILSLPEKVRGYGHIKARNARQVEQERQQLLEQLNDNNPKPVKWVDPKAA